MKSFSTRSSWSLADKIAAAISALGLAVFAIHPEIGKLEGRIDPVVSDFRVAKIEPSGDTSTRLWGTMDILRPECTFNRIEWYLVGPHREVLIDLDFEEGTKVRPGGAQSWGSWRLRVPPYEMGKTRAVVLHQCPFRPWLVVTTVYP